MPDLAELTGSGKSTVNRILKSDLTNVKGISSFIIRKEDEKLQHVSDSRKFFRKCSVYERDAHTLD